MRQSNPAPDAEFLTLEETTKRLGVPEETLRTWWKARLIPEPFSLGKKGARGLRYSRRVVEAIAILIECRHLPPSATPAPAPPPAAPETPPPGRSKH
jgi:hypothetical protein